MKLEFKKLTFTRLSIISVALVLVVASVYVYIVIDGRKQEERRVMQQLQYQQTLSKQVKDMYISKLSGSDLISFFYIYESLKTALDSLTHLGINYESGDCEYSSSKAMFLCNIEVSSELPTVFLPAIVFGNDAHEASNSSGSSRYSGMPLKTVSPYYFEQYIRGDKVIPERCVDLNVKSANIIEYANTDNLSFKISDAVPIKQELELVTKGYNSGLSFGTWEYIGSDIHFPILLFGNKNLTIKYVNTFKSGVEIRGEFVCQG